MFTPQEPRQDDQSNPPALNNISPKELLAALSRDQPPGDITDIATLEVGPRHPAAFTLAETIAGGLKHAQVPHMQTLSCIICIHHASFFHFEMHVDIIALIG